MKIGILSTEIYEDAKNFKKELLKKYNNFINVNKNNIDSIDVFLVLGGDGFLLRSLHKYYKYNIPFFGVNYGNLGFLLNDKKILKNNLIEVIEEGQLININPLKNFMIDLNDNEFEDISVNELTLIRNVYKTCNINIKINGEEKLKNYCGDGLVVSTPIGSTAYNSSLGSPIISYRSNNIILSSISPFRPRTFRNAILQNDLKLEFYVNYSKDRKVSAYADFVEYKNIKYTKTSIDKSINIKLLFGKDFNLDSKIMKEQFNI